MEMGYQYLSRMISIDKRDGKGFSAAAVCSTYRVLSFVPQQEKAEKPGLEKNNPTARKIDYLSGMKDKACWTEPVTRGPERATTLSMGIV